MSLKQEIDALIAEASTRIPPEMLARIQTSIDEVARSGIALTARSVGDPAPDFTLPNAQGRPVALAALLANGPLVLSFYRGVWCPYCNLELRAYQRILPEIRAAGGDFVAISPQTPEHSLATAQTNELGFDVLNDHGNAIAAKFGIAYAIPQIVKDITAKFGVDLTKLNGATDDRLPISATYVIAKDRRIAFASIDPDFRVRAEPLDVLKALRQIASDTAQTLQHA